MKLQKLDSERLEEVTSFLDRYRSFTHDQTQDRFTRFCDDFERLRVGMTARLRQAEEERRRTASSFNLFHVLGVAHDEVRTHSALLADLLDPNGRHAQGTLFLERFLSFCADEFNVPVPSPPLPDTGWAVRSERVTPQGNLDLVLSSSRLGYLYVIENKIWAIEQKNQLARYNDWMQQHYSLYPYQALFYLTPDGRPSLTHNGAAYHRLSYCHHILPWLEKTLPEVAAPRLVETLLQYIDILKSFGGSAR